MSRSMSCRKEPLLNAIAPELQQIEMALEEVAGTVLLWNR